MQWLRFIKFVSSWKVFFALIIPSVAIDYLLFDGEATFFFWFLILYGAFILPLSFSFYFRGGKQRLAALESGDPQKVKKQQEQDNMLYLAILVLIAFVLLYGFLNGV